jgi:hypothetical protein
MFHPVLGAEPPDDLVRLALLNPDGACPFGKLFGESFQLLVPTGMPLDEDVGIESRLDSQCQPCRPFEKALRCFCGEVGKEEVALRILLLGGSVTASRKRVEYLFTVPNLQ